MKQIVFLFFCMMTCITGFSQSIAQIKSDHANYLWGEGTGTNTARADQTALQQLISQISAQVESSFTLLKEEAEKAGKTNFSEQSRMIVNTYSNATLNNTERIVTGEEPEVKVFRYIKRSEVKKVFQQREAKIMEFITMAANATQKLQIADALRYYYWALALLRSHPDANSMKYTGLSGKETLLLSYLPSQVNELLQNLQFTVIEITGTPKELLVQLDIRYQGNPVANLEYSFWQGQDWSELVAAKDGLGVMAFYDDNNQQPSDVRLKVEVMFENEARVDREVEDVMKQIDPVPFKKAFFNIKMVKQPKPESKNHQPQSPQPVAVSGTKTTFGDLKISQVANPEFYTSKVKQVLATLDNGLYVNARPLFTDDGYKMFTSLLAYGQAKIIEIPELKVVKFGNNTICRSVKMFFTFKNNNRQFVEDIVFFFDNNAKIDAVAFSLGEIAINSILEKTIWTEVERLTIITFLEHYKTAYALKRLDYINSIFADDALIIVGHIVKVKPNADNPFAGNKIISYNRMKKEQYIKNLSHCFASNEFINLKFEDSYIRKAGQESRRYGVQIRQNYYSVNYADEGYLFLLVDFQNPDEPLIYIRTWQPERNPDGSIYGAEDFF